VASQAERDQETSWESFEIYWEDGSTKEPEFLQPVQQYIIA
jgi:hypothetical protein